MKIEAFANSISTQSYKSKSVIDGVYLSELKKFNDDGGSFSEILRIDENSIIENLPSEFKIAQVSWSILQPDAIKAFHLHYNQDDLWFIPGSESLLVGLYDIRDDSPTFKTQMRLMLGCGKSHILYIPRGVAHGCANLDSKPMHLIYFVNNKFDPDFPDEHRLPYSLLGDSFWEKTPG